MELLYADEYLVVCVKPAGVLSTDEPGGVPELVRQALGDENANVRTVHRLDRVVGGLMVLARRKHTAADLSKQIRENAFEKEYRAVIHGRPEEEAGTFTDLLIRDKESRRTLVTGLPGKDAQEAALFYRVLAHKDGLSRVAVKLHTGRTHQIRVQFSSRGMPLVGDKKYGHGEDGGIGLWSCRVAFIHPKTGEQMEFFKEPPETFPWDQV